MQVTWHLLGMFFWEIYEIFRTGFTRNTRECRLLQLVVARKCFVQKIFFKKYLIRVYYRSLKNFHDVYLGLYLVCSAHFSSYFIWASGNVTSIVSITHTAIFSKEEVSRRRVARGSPGENKCSWNSGKKKL